MSTLDIVYPKQLLNWEGTIKKYQMKWLFTTLFQPFEYHGLVSSRVEIIDLRRHRYKPPVGPRGEVGPGHPRPQGLERPNWHVLQKCTGWNHPNRWWSELTYLKHIYIIYYIHYIALHCIALHYITLHYITSRYSTLHYITSHYSTLHYITLHHTTVHYITYTHTHIYIYIYKYI